MTTSLLGVLLAVVVAAALIALILRSPAVGLALILVAFLASGDARPGGATPSVHVGSIALYPMDMALIIVLLAYALRRSRGLGEGAVPRPLLVFTLLLAVNAIRGAESYGVQEAINGSRRWWWLVGAAIFASSVRWDTRVTRWLTMAATALIGIAVYGFLTVGIQSATAFKYVGGEYITLRALSAAAALLLLQIVIVIAFSGDLHPKLKFGVIAVAVPVLLLVEQRTVWAAALVIGPLLYIGWVSRIHRRQPERGYALVGLLSLCAPVAAFALLRSHTILTSVRTISGQHSTIVWRLDSWRAVLRGMAPTDWIIGQPSGEPLNRYVFGQLTSVQPHSLYVEAIVRFGVLGIPLLIAIWIVALRGIRTSVFPWPRWAGYALITSQVLFGLTYALGPADGVWLGLLMGAVAVAEGARARAGLQVVYGERPLAAHPAA